MLNEADDFIKLLTIIQNSEKDIKKIIEYFIKTYSPYIERMALYNAEINYKVYKKYCDCGFTPEDAMSLMLKDERDRKESIKGIKNNVL